MVTLPLILIIVSIILALLDMVLGGRHVGTPRSFLLPVAVVLLGVAVLVPLVGH